MSEEEKSDGGPAFPECGSPVYEVTKDKIRRTNGGMSLRAYIAAQVMAQNVYHGADNTLSADLAVQAADALIERLGR